MRNHVSHAIGAMPTHASAANFHDLGEADHMLHKQLSKAQKKSTRKAMEDWLQEAIPAVATLETRIEFVGRSRFLDLPLLL